MVDNLPADPRVGSEIAGYKVERLLGRGGMSVVYLATDLRLKRSVALKLMGSDLAGDERFRERFLRESELAASLDHPSVVPIYEANEVDGVLYLAMRYVEGTDLARRLAGSGWLEPSEALAILEPVAEALDAAHTRGLVHRDVKPGNILLSGEGHVYLSDFGLTRRRDEAGALTESHEIVGTLDYVAPEQIENASVSARTDVYALACVLFECLTGERPFSGDSASGLLFAHLQQQPPSACERNPALPAAIDSVVATGMAEEPDARHASCVELIGEARAALGLSIESSPPVLVVRRRRRTLLAVAAVLVMVAAVAAVVLATGGDDAPAGDQWSRVVHDESTFGGSTEAVAWGVVAGESGLVAVGSAGDGPRTESAAAVWTSSDGKSWSRVEDAGLFEREGQIMTGVAIGEQGFVAVGWQANGPERPDSRPRCGGMDLA